jgi:phage terminase large subunit-like protein
MSFVRDVSAVLGRTEPRIFTPPLRELAPATSYGFDVAEFAADVLGAPLDPWQEWLAVHAGELLPDGRPRFRQVLVLASRQNGKTHLPVVLSLYWQFVEAVPLILGTSTKIEYAKESWQKAVKLAEKCADLDDVRPAPWTRLANGEQESWTVDGSRYKIAASNAEGGRSLTIHRLILDELRQHHDYSAWNASVPAGNAVRDFQVWCMSNAGDDRSVVLNELRDAAVEFIEHGDGDYRLGLFEWSAPDDSDPLDIEALAMANPNLNRRLDAEALLGDAKRAVKKGGEALTGFKTEYMCIRVKHLDPAIDPAAWARCLDPGDLAAVRGRVAVCLDVAPDAQHATLVAAARCDDGRVRVEPVRDWSGAGCTDAVRRELPALLARVKPQTLGWFPNGPAAALAADLADRTKQGRRGWPPPGVTVTEIRGELSATCMGFAELIAAGQLAHAGDPLLDAHVGAAERLRRGDAWVFSRRGEGNIDAAYAAAGAAHLARTQPATVGKPRLVVAKEPG